MSQQPAPATLRALFLSLQTQLSEQGAEAVWQALAAIKKTTDPPLPLAFTDWLAGSDPGAALVCLQQWADKLPDRLAVDCRLGALYEQLGDNSAALEVLQPILADPAASPKQRLLAAVTLSRLQLMPAVLQAACQAYADLGRPVQEAPPLLFILQKSAHWYELAKVVQQLQQAHANGQTAAIAESPRSHLLWCDDASLNRAVIGHWNRRCLPVVQPFTGNIPALHQRKIRIGYLSGDFREHPTARLINGLLRHHDRQRFELLMFCCGWDDGSAMRQTITAQFDAVFRVSDLDNRQAADLIAAQQIDILVDLNGPTRAHRMGILAQRPAAVQIDYLGWPGSVGGRVVDYIIGDSHTVPAGSERNYPERVIKLSDSYQINDHAALPPLTHIDRSAVGLPAERQVIGMFNSMNKVSGVCWAAWLDILKAVPEAVLWLLAPEPVSRHFIGQWTKAMGVDSKRIFLAPHLPQTQHLQRLQCCDLMLDPWPYGGHTSTSDALFAGVPVISLQGNNFASRVSGGLLQAAGLEALVQTSVTDYVTTAIRLLQQPQQLAALKQQLLTTVLQSPLFDAAGKTRQIEAAFTAVLQRAAAGKNPAHSQVSRGAEVQFLPD